MIDIKTPVEIVEVNGHFGWGIEGLKHLFAQYSIVNMNGQAGFIILLKVKGDISGSRVGIQLHNPVLRLSIRVCPG